VHFLDKSDYKLDVLIKEAKFKVYTENLERERCSANYIFCVH